MHDEAVAFCSRVCCHKPSLVAFLLLIKGSIIIPYMCKSYNLLSGALQNSIFFDISSNFGVYNRYKKVINQWKQVPPVVQTSSTLGCPHHRLESDYWSSLWRHRHLLFSLGVQSLDFKVNSIKLQYAEYRERLTVTIRSHGRTWVIEGYQYVGWGLLLSALLAIDKAQGNSFRLSDVVAHAACGVDDPAERRRPGETHQPAAAS